MNKKYLGPHLKVVNDSVEPRYISMYSLWEISDFLIHMRAKIQFDRQVERIDRKIGLESIDFLFLQAQKPRSQRNQNEIVRVWRLVKPIFEKYGMFAEFYGESTLKFRLQIFIFGRSS